MDSSFEMPRISKIKTTTNFEVLRRNCVSNLEEIKINQTNCSDTEKSIHEYLRPAVSKRVS